MRIAPAFKEYFQRGDNSKMRNHNFDGPWLTDQWQEHSLPYGGIRQCAACRYISSDQYEHALFDYAANTPFKQNQNIINLLLIGLYFCRQRGYYRRELDEIMESLWRLDHPSISSDGLGYDQSGVTDDQWIEPHHDRHRPSGVPLFDWRGNQKTAHSLKTAHTAALLQRIRHDEDRAAKITLILNHFQKPTDCLRWVDPDGKQTPPELGYLCNTVPLQFVGTWLEAYQLTHAGQQPDGL